MSASCFVLFYELVFNIPSFSSLSLPFTPVQAGQGTHGSFGGVSPARPVFPLPLLSHNSPGSRYVLRTSGSPLPTGVQPTLLRRNTRSRRAG